MSKKLPMTANERKAINREKVLKLQEKEERKNNKTPADKKTLIIVLSVSIAVVLLFVLSIAIWLPNRKLDTGGDGTNPIAVIKLSNGMTLEYELYYDVAPRAVSNFIYLAQSGIYNGSMIHKIKDGYAEAGRYKAYASPNNKTDVYENREPKYNYAIRTESGTYNGKISSFGYISTVSSTNGGHTKSDFRLTVGEDAVNYQIHGVVFGFARGDKTLKNLKEIAAIETNNTDYTPHDRTVISKITIRYNYNKKNPNSVNWKKYNFTEDENHKINDDYYMA